MIPDIRIKGYESQVCAPTTIGTLENELQDAVNCLLGERRELITALTESQRIISEQHAYMTKTLDHVKQLVADREKLIRLLDMVGVHIEEVALPKEGE